MPFEKEKQGLELTEYKSELQNGTYALRIGKEVPEGDINLAYIHTPKVQVDENISLIDTSYTSDNVIPHDQIESMVVANTQGYLEYIDMIGNGEVRSRPPKDTFPSDKINVTRKFKKNEMDVENALYYKFEIDYHYDSRKAIPNDAGNYLLEKYTGQQIELTDENGNLLDSTYKYDIYVQPHALNPHIYSMKIYLNKNSDKEETIKVRYNHVDQIVKDASIQTVQRSIEFYTNKENILTVDNQGKQMLEGGKLRILNGESAFEKRTEQEVRDALLNDNDSEIFSVVPKENGEGYQIMVPQKSESDPRVPRIFTHRVVAEYIGSDDQKVKVSVGHITDWCINPDTLLKNEVEDYSGAWKNIGIPTGGGKLNAKEMIELSLPFGTPSIPSDAQFSIEDDKGNLLYSITTLTDNPNIDTQINEVMSKSVEAKANGLTQKPWSNAMQDNTVIKNNPISHRCSIIPERQKTKWDFTWKADGAGYTEKTTNYKTNWQACANVGFKKSIQPNTLDLLDKTKWATLGNASDVNKWQYSYVAEMGKNVIEYLENADDVMGFYQKNEMINGTLTDLMSKTDYQFSTKVRLTDPVDDDTIGIMFRVQDAQNYYMFVWEKDELSTENKTYTFDHGEGIVGTQNGCGRIILDAHGYDSVHYQPEGGAAESWKWTNDQNKYLQNMGFKKQHKRIMKATPNDLSPFVGTDETAWNGNTRYPSDKTNCRFDDITNLSSGYNTKGWEYGKDYKITVVVTGELFRIYITENVESDELGALVCQGTDNAHPKGTYGIFCASQRWTYWYDLNMTEIVVDTICTPKKDIVLTDMQEKKLSNYTATDMLEPFIKDRAAQSFEGAAYEVFTYEGKSDGEFTIRIDPIDDFVYGKTNNPTVGGVIRSNWLTSENGLTVNGIGSVEYHADGHYTIITSPNILPSDQVPSNVLDFKWDAPSILSGENISIALVQPNYIKLTATVPPIRIVGQPYVLADKDILKTDGFKHMEFLFNQDGEEGFYDKFEIPTNIPIEEIMLRIERGAVTALQADGTAVTENAENRVNYRFRCQKDGFTRLPVDQFQDQIGVNRLRLKSVLKGSSLDPSLSIDMIAWTTFQDLEAVPLFAIKIEEQRKIEIEKPKIEYRNINVDNWYLRIKNGRFLKRLVLPYYEDGLGEKVPEVYVAYPQLLGMVTSPDDIVEVDLEYNLDKNELYSLEYRNQEFHNKPYVLIDKESPAILNEYTIQTRYAPLVLSSETGKSYLEVYSIRANQRRSLRVSDVDAAKGIIYLHDRIREQDDVLVRYAYREDWLTYRGFYNYTTTKKVKTGTLDISALLDVKIIMTAEYDIDDTPPNVTLKTILETLADSTYDYADLVDGKIPVTIRATDDLSGIQKWSISCEGWNQSDDSYSKEVLDTGDVSLQIPIVLPEKTTSTSKSGKADIVFVTDVSGSMEGPIGAMADQIQNFVGQLNVQEIDWQAGVTTYSDVTISEAILKRPFRTKTEVSSLIDDLNTLRIKAPTSSDWGLKFGGDGPESALEGMMDNTNGGMSFPFREDASKYFILLTDARYHSQDDDGKSIYFINDVVDTLIANKIKVSVVTQNSVTQYGLFTFATGGQLLDINGDYGASMTSVADDIIKSVARIPTHSYEVTVEAWDYTGKTASDSLILTFTDGSAT